MTKRNQAELAAKLISLFLGFGTAETFKYYPICKKALTTLEKAVTITG